MSSKRLVMKQSWETPIKCALHQKHCILQRYFFFFFGFSGSKFPLLHRRKYAYSMPKMSPGADRLLRPSLTRAYASGEGLLTRLICDKAKGLCGLAIRRQWYASDKCNASLVVQIVSCSKCDGSWFHVSFVLIAYHYVFGTLKWRTDVDCVGIGDKSVDPKLRWNEFHEICVTCKSSMWWHKITLCWWRSANYINSTDNNQGK